MPTEDGKYSSDVYDRRSCDCTLRSTLISDRILYYIIAGVMGGVLLVVLVIVLVALFAYGKQRYNQRKKTLSKHSYYNNVQCYEVNY